MILTLELIKHLLEAQGCVVNYEEGETYCPICRYAGLPQGKVLVSQTSQEIRYCTCCQCNATFRAIGKTAEELRIIRKAEKDAEKLIKKTKQKVGKGLSAVKSLPKGDKEKLTTYTEIKEDIKETKKPKRKPRGKKLKLKKGKK